MLFQERTEPEILKPQSSLEKLLLFMHHICITLKIQTGNFKKQSFSWISENYVKSQEVNCCSTSQY